MTKHQVNRIVTNLCPISPRPMSLEEKRHVQVLMDEWKAPPQSDFVYSAISNKKQDCQRHEYFPDSSYSTFGPQTYYKKPKPKPIRGRPRRPINADPDVAGPSTSTGPAHPPFNNSLNPPVLKKMRSDSAATDATHTPSMGKSIVPASNRPLPMNPAFMFLDCDSEDETEAARKPQSLATQKTPPNREALNSYMQKFHGLVSTKEDDGYTFEELMAAAEADYLPERKVSSVKVIEPVDNNNWYNDAKFAPINDYLNKNHIATVNFEVIGKKVDECFPDNNINKVELFEYICRTRLLRAAMMTMGDTLSMAEPCTEDDKQHYEDAKVFMRDEKLTEAEEKALTLELKNVPVTDDDDDEAEEEKDTDIELMYIAEHHRPKPIKVMNGGNGRKDGRRSGDVQLPAVIRNIVAWNSEHSPPRVPDTKGNDDDDVITLD